MASKTIEHAGVIHVDPSLTKQEIEYLRRLERAADRRIAVTTNRAGTQITAGRDASVRMVVESLRTLMSTMERRGRWSGMIAVYDADTRELTAIRVSHGRVTHRVLHRGAETAEQPTLPRNVIELAERRRRSSRAIS